MEDLPREIIRFDALRVEYGMAKLCQCKTASYEIDYQNRLVYCQSCGAIVDPFEALLNIAKYIGRYEDHLKYMLEERKKLESWNPRLLVVKSLVDHYHSGKMAPVCPRCREAFDLKEIASWTDARFVRPPKEDIDG